VPSKPPGNERKPIDTAAAFEQRVQEENNAKFQELQEKMIKAATRLSVLVAARPCGPIRIGFRNPVLFVALLAQPIIDGWMGTSARAMAVRCRLTLTILLCHCCHS
jgi:hypothetical protein